MERLNRCFTIKVSPIKQTVLLKESKTDVQCKKSFKLKKYWISNKFLLLRSNKIIYLLILLKFYRALIFLYRKIVSILN